MKTAIPPTLRVDAALDKAAFLKRGIASRNKAHWTGAFHDAGEVVGELRQMLAHAQAGARPAPPA